MTFDERRPQIVKSWLSQQSFNLSVKTRTHFSQRKVIGQPRGNLECGSAQPSLFNYFDILDIDYLSNHGSDHYMWVWNIEYGDQTNSCENCTRWHVQFVGKTIHTIKKQNWREIKEHLSPLGRHVKNCGLWHVPPRSLQKSLKQSVLLGWTDNATSTLKQTTLINSKCYAVYLAHSLCIYTALQLNCRLACWRKIDQLETKLITKLTFNTHHPPGHF